MGVEPSTSCVRTLHVTTGLSGEPMGELERYDIHNMHTHKLVAASSAWKDCKFTPVFRAILEKWAQQENITFFEQRLEDYSDHFYWSKTLASPPLSLRTPPQQAVFYISSIISTVYGMKMLRKSYYMTKYASTTDSAKTLEYSAIARLSSAEKRYAKYLIPSLRLRGLGFIALPLLFVMSCKYSQFIRKGNE